MQRHISLSGVATLQGRATQAGGWPSP